MPTTVDYSSVPKQTDVEEWTSWDEDAPTSVKIEGGNGNVATQQNALEQLEPDYFKDMTPTIRKTQKIIIKKREPLNFGIPDLHINLFRNENTVARQVQTLNNRNCVIAMMERKTCPSPSPPARRRLRAAASRAHTQGARTQPRFLKFCFLCTEFPNLPLATSVTHGWIIDLVESIGAN